MADLKKYQIHCPECGHEFVWDHDELDWQIVNLSKKQKDLYKMITDMQNNNTSSALAHSVEFAEMKKKCGDLRYMISEMKAIKHNNHGITGEIFMQEFKEAFRDVYGDEAFYKLIEITQERLKPRHIEFIMKERPKG